MAVATPLSLENITTEFGLGELSTQTFNSGSGSVTAPADAAAVRIKIWGGGGGGENGGEFAVGQGGGGGGFVLKTVNVTGGSTTASYSVGAAGLGNYGPGQLSGTSGGNSSVTINAVTYTGYGGVGGSNPDGAGGATSNNGDVNENGQNGTYGAGGPAGGLSYGGGGADTAPGGGGNGGQYASSDGGSGRVVFEWLFKGLSTYTRGSGEIANHAANASIPTSASNLGISQFSGAEKSFTATITSADISGTQDPPNSYATRGYISGSSGSINRDQVGTNDNNLNTTTLLEVVEVPGYDYFFNAWNYTVSAKFSGDVRSATLGYDFFSSIFINGFPAGGAQFSTQSFDGVNTTFGFTAGFTQRFGADGSSNSVELVYGGP